jgi:putative transposase
MNAWRMAIIRCALGIGLYKTEIVEPRGPGKSFDAVEFAVADWVAWFITKRPLGPIGDVPPAEAEDVYWKSLEHPAMAA